MQPYRAGAPDPASGVGSDCRKSLALRTRSTGHPLGGNRTGAGQGQRRPLESKVPAVTASTLPMVPRP